MAPGTARQMVGPGGTGGGVTGGRQLDATLLACPPRIRQALVDAGYEAVHDVIGSSAMALSRGGWEWTASILQRARIVAAMFSRQTIHRSDNLCR